MKKKFTKLLSALVAATCLGTAIADDHHHHHHQFAKDVDAFHAVLAPVWHARPGPERLPNACAKVDELTRLASDIRSTDASKLVASIASRRPLARTSRVTSMAPFTTYMRLFTTSSMQSPLRLSANRLPVGLFGET